MLTVARAALAAALEAKLPLQVRLSGSWSSLGSPTEVVNCDGLAWPKGASGNDLHHATRGESELRAGLAAVVDEADPRSQHRTFGFTRSKRSRAELAVFLRFVHRFCVHATISGSVCLRLHHP